MKVYAALCEWSTDTEVNRALTSYDVITSPASSLLFGFVGQNVCSNVVGRLENQRFDDVSQFFCHPICYGPLLDTMGLRRCQLCGFWPGHKTWGTELVGYSFLYFWSLQPPIP